MASNTASLACDWRLFCPESWDDTTTDNPDQAQTRPRPSEHADVGHTYPTPYAEIRRRLG